MRKRKVLVILAAVFVAAVLTVLIWPHEKEPVEPEWDSKKLSEWLYIYRESSDKDPQLARAARAVQSIGTNALPVLISWIDHTPAIRAQVGDSMIGDMWKSVGVHRANETAVLRADRLAGYGVLGFRILRTNAAAAVPELERRLLKNSPGVAWIAVATSMVGQQGFGPLLNAMTNGPPSNRRFVAKSIGSMDLGTNAAVAVQVLARFVTDQNAETASGAIEGIRRLRAAPEVAVPVLEKALKDQRSAVRRDAATALGFFREKARPALPALLAALNDPDKNVRYDVTNAVSRIAPEFGMKAVDVYPHEGLPVGVGKAVPGVGTNAVRDGHE